MKSLPRPLIAVAVLLALGALAWFLLAPGEKPERWLGYVEGETIYVAAPLPGRLASRAVERGASVAAGDALFSLDTVTTDADTARAEAEVASARAQASDLGNARQRQAELDVWRANARAAQAEVTRTQRDYARISQLTAEGIASRAQLDAARAARDGAKAQLDQAQAQIRAGEMSAGRAGQIRAAQAGVAGAEAALRGQRQRRSDIAPVSPAAGVVEETYFNPGEWVPAGAPVVAVLPNDRRKLRFFVPEARIATLKRGAALRFTCDGCGGERQAKIVYVSPRAEFAPPVIYSERARSKLVFLVEASLPASAQPLPLGLPVEVIPQ